MTKPTILIAAVALFVAYLAWAVSGIPLLGDDWGHAQLAVKGLSEIWSTSWVGERDVGGYYRPVSETTFYLFGTGSVAVHLFNLAVHLLVSAVVALLAVRLLPTAKGAALGSGLLFFVLPIHVSDVFWGVGRGDMLCTLFYCASLLAFPSADDRGIRRALWVGCFALAGYLSKEMALTLPAALVMLAAYESTLKRPSTRAAIIASAVAVVVCGVLRWIVLGSAWGNVPTPGLGAFVFDAFRAAGLMGISDIKAFGVPLLVFTLVIGVVLRRDPRHLILLVALTGIAVLPALGRLHRWYLYLPSVFYALFLASIWLSERSKAVQVRQFVFGLLVSYYAGVTGAQALDWRDAGRLSDRFLKRTVDAIESGTGRVLLLNVPAALDGIPIFAHNLRPALRTHGVEPDEVILGTHVWLLDTEGGVEVERRAGSVFDLTFRESRLSFHQGESPKMEGRTLVAQAVETSWGLIEVASDRAAMVRVDALATGDRVLAYSGSEYEVFTFE
ncbi:TPA: hypothetical protein DCE37_16365 [Candidatus Latescibacteria bacterium]|nr:hypothetical protein [Candidatus Latescibacterota bacterium]